MRLKSRRESSDRLKILQTFSELWGNFFLRGAAWLFDFILFLLRLQKAVDESTYLCTDHGERFSYSNK